MMATRRAGVLIPLFSLRSSAGWGIGDIGDVAAACAWLQGAGVRILQMLPLNEMAPGTQSPYSALTAMAIDPIYIRVTDVADWQGAGGPSTLTPADRADIEMARLAARVQYAPVRRVKLRALETAFAHFVAHEWTADTARASALRAFLAAEAWWLDDYALFREIGRAHV